MTGLLIEQTAAGRLSVRGNLDFDTAADALPRGLSLIGSAQNVEIDLTGVSSGDSAGLAVLVEWLASAQSRGARLRYVGVPKQILAVAHISDIEELLTT